MSFLVENFWPIVAVLGAGIAASAWLFLRGGGSRAIASAVVLSAAAAVLVVVDVFADTPVKQARRALEVVLDAARSGDAETIVRSIADDYADGSRDRAGIESLVRRHVPQAKLSQLTVNGLQLAREGNDRVVTKFVAHARGTYEGHATGGESYPVRMRIDFGRRPDGWKMTSIRRFDPIQSTREIPLDRIP